LAWLERLPPGLGASGFGFAGAPIATAVGAQLWVGIHPPPHPPFLSGSRFTGVRVGLQKGIERRAFRCIPSSPRPLVAWVAGVRRVQSGGGVGLRVPQARLARGRVARLGLGRGLSADADGALRTPSARRGVQRPPRTKPVLAGETFFRARRSPP
jgi:hypothetical protein